MKAHWETVLNEWDSAFTRFVGSLAGSLSTDLDVKTAVDLVWALERPEVYRELVITRGWPPEHYECWLASTLKQQLLPAAEKRPAAA